MEMAGTSHPKVRLKRTVTKKCKAGKGDEPKVVISGHEEKESVSVVSEVVI